MMQKFNSFQSNKITNFLNENLDNSRMFSLSATLGPNYPSAFKISTVGYMGAFNDKSFYSFNHNLLNQDALRTNLGWPPVPPQKFF